jgi:hypothetical protein
MYNCTIYSLATGKKTRIWPITPFSLCWLAADMTTVVPYRQCYFALGISGELQARVATAAFWRTFSDEGKISPGWWGWGVHAHPLSLHLPSPVKLQWTLQLSGQIHWPCFISTNICTLCCRLRRNTVVHVYVWLEFSYDAPEGHPQWTAWVHYHDSYPIDVSYLNFNILCLLLL